MERVNIRLLGAPVSVDAAIPAFHSWIQRGDSEELLIDVVDYRHVPDGPGVVLIGHEADYSLSSSGLTYSRKTKQAGSDADRIAFAWNRATEAAQRLELEWSDFEVIINDRIGTPNTDENWQLLQRTLAEVFGGDATITRQGDHRTRLTARVAPQTKAIKTNPVDAPPHQNAVAR